MEVKLTVIIPVYNEAYTLKVILDRLIESLPGVHEILAVDDGSKDKSRLILTDYSAINPVLKPIFHEVNSGKTAALRTGIQASSGNVIIVQDADLEYDPGDISSLLSQFKDDHVDAVYGSRFKHWNIKGVRYSQHYLANRFLTLLSNLFTGYKLTDMETCYKAIKGDLLRAMPIRSERFGFEVEVTAYLSKNKAVVREVPISYKGRSYSEGKKIGLKDGLMAIWYILKFNLFS